MFRLVLNELKIKLDGVNESEESINGDFDQPRFGFDFFVISGSWIGSGTWFWGRVVGSDAKP